MNIFSSALWLNVEKNEGYGPKPIPDPRDAEISELLDKWMALPAPERQVAAAQIAEGQRFTLLAYSERMASLAVRTSDKAHLLRGLVALGVDGWRNDWRDNALLLSLHYDAAVRVGVQPSQIFDAAGSLLSTAVSKRFSEFLKRSDEDRSLEAMGYSTGADQQGFRYLRDW